MSHFHCPTCETLRHVATSGEGVRVEVSGKLPTEDCCWYCGTPTGESDANVTHEPPKPSR